MTGYVLKLKTQRPVRNSRKDVLLPTAVRRWSRNPQICASSSSATPLGTICFLEWVSLGDLSVSIGAPSVIPGATKASVRTLHPHKPSQVWFVSSVQQGCLRNSVSVACSAVPAPDLGSGRIAEAAAKAEAWKCRLRGLLEAPLPEGQAPHS